MDRNKGFKNVIVFDLDGTLANCEHRVHLAKDKKWDEFFDACDKDTPIQNVIDIMRMSYISDNQILLLTGRSVSCRKKTEEWITTHTGFTPGHILSDFSLVMRDTNDFRPDSVSKVEALESYLKVRELIRKDKMTKEQYMIPLKKDKVLAIYDDRSSVVKAFREKGYTVMQVAEGDF